LLDRSRRVLLTGSAFLLFFAGGALLSYLVLPIARAICGGGEEDKARRCRRIVGASWVFFHAYMRGLRLVSYAPRETRLDLPLPPFVLVANHPTLVDVTAVGATYPDLVVVAKHAYFASPLVGRLLRYCGHIDGGDGSAFSGVAVIELAVERLRRGISVLIFPEGTRSPEHGLGPFHLGAFLIAAQARVPIVPVVITCDPPTLMRGQAWYEVPKRPAQLAIRQLPAFDAAGGDIRARSRELRTAYLAELGLERGRRSGTAPAPRAPGPEAGAANG
jgi:1-acyl-sn-glycerol-3-phosphate acyltransferase